MIIVKLMGGLGNQMFQYALGRRLALKHNVKLKLDISQLNDRSIQTEHTVREYALEMFNINAFIASENELHKYRKGKAGKIIDMLLLYLPFKMNGLFIREPYFRFFKKVLDSPKEVYLDGYWQSEKYFYAIREQLLEEFSPKVMLSGENKRLADKMKEEQSVSIHVRRGDYLSIAANTGLFEVCDETYYTDAINEVSKFGKGIVLYVFSDEPEWFQKNIRTTCPVEYVNHNTGKDSYLDMHLMSLCKHNIIANSSFSWWGAWLNSNKNKTVIAPKKWFKNNSKDIQDLIPEEWIKL